VDRFPLAEAIDRPFSASSNLCWPKATCGHPATPAMPIAQPGVAPRLMQFLGARNIEERTLRSSRGSERLPVGRDASPMARPEFSWLPVLFKGSHSTVPSLYMPHDSNFAVRRKRKRPLRFQGDAAILCRHMASSRTSGVLGSSDGVAIGSDNARHT